MDWDRFLDLANRLGVPLVILGVFAFFVWRAARFITQHFFLPLLRRHTQFLDSLEQAFKENGRAINRMAAAQEALFREQGKVCHYRRFDNGPPPDPDAS